MTAYLVIRVAVTDWDRYREYMALTPAALAKYQGRFIARGGESVTLEGPEETRRLALVEFPPGTGQGLLRLARIPGRQGIARRRL